MDFVLETATKTWDSFTIHWPSLQLSDTDLNCISETVSSILVKLSKIDSKYELTSFNGKDWINNFNASKLIFPLS